MRLAVRARHLELPAAQRVRIESRVRLSVGHQVAEVEAAQVLLEGPTSRRRGLRCQLALSCLGGERVSFDETGRDPDEALDLALWRLRGWLRRRERVRAYGAPDAAEGGA
ncbi:MAG: hypothetical protein QNK03_11500 [Myxococcota bacterium]|nr:hypothetical protein [Myxococcota bacterium]